MATYDEHRDIDTPKLRHLRSEDLSLDVSIRSHKNQASELEAQQQHVQNKIKEEVQYELSRNQGPQTAWGEC